MKAQIAELRAVFLSEEERGRKRREERGGRRRRRAGQTLFVRTLHVQTVHATHHFFPRKAISKEQIVFAKETIEDH